MRIVADACREGQVLPTTFVTGMIMVEDLLGPEFLGLVESCDVRVISLIDRLMENVANEDRIWLGNWLNNLSWEFCKAQDESPGRLKLADELVRKSLALLPKVQLQSNEKEQQEVLFNTIFSDDFSRIELYTLYSRALKTLGVAELKSGKPTEAIQHFNRAIVFYEALGHIRALAALGGSAPSG